VSKPFARGFRKSLDAIQLVQSIKSNKMAFMTDLDCWQGALRDSYHAPFALLPGQADITHCGGHFYDLLTQRRSFRVSPLSRRSRFACPEETTCTRSRRRVQVRLEKKLLLCTPTGCVPSGVACTRAVSSVKSTRCRLNSTIDQARHSP